ncbi:TonB-dependent receptor [Polymorphobacter multimanifer]|uniref:TonB-dependent receptor n=1 Tax=Polymorphobacter multimanifer TaxID=1070431 RepID=UPI0016683253|nr:TonB-dependent receptor [Polymorphobacter multimanifer]GGI73083.1 TonB-dependent receptor [Polymorphobacter multimanifer]
MTAILRAGLLLCAAAVAPAAVAQEAQPTLAEEIIVTASKTEQRLGLVTASVAAFDSEALARFGAQDANALLGRVAGLSIETSQPGFARYVIRGVNAGGQFGWRQGAATAIYLDEAPLTTRTNFFFASPDINLYDMARIEVLRGPQGTLYGASAIGGAIRAVPTAPDRSTFSAKGEAELSSTQDAGSPNFALRGAVNLPLATDTAALRISGDYVENQGFIDAILIRTQDFVTEAATAPRIRDYNSQNRLTLRAALSLLPAEGVEIVPSLTYLRNRAGGAGDFALNAFGNRNRATVFAFNPTFEADGRPYEFVNDELVVASLKMTADIDALGGLQLVSATNWQDRRAGGRDDSIASNGSWVVGFGFDDTYAASVDPSWGEFGTRGRQFSQEVRLVTTGSQSLQLVGGLFYNRLRQTDTILYSFEGSPQALFDQFGVADAISYDGRDDFAEDEYAAFANAELRLGGGFAVAGGLRVTHYTQMLLRGASFPAFDDPGDRANPSRLTASETRLTPRLVASWRGSDGVTAYVSAAEGFRTGGGNPPENLRGQCPDRSRFPAQPDQFDADSAWSYEVGVKARTRDNRLAINAAAFRVDWQDIQTGVSFTCADNSVVSYTGNAGTARIQGVEIEAALALLPDLNASAVIGYTHGKFTADAPEAGITRGERLGYIPEWTFNFRLDYSAPQPLIGQFKPYAAADVRHVGNRIDPLYGPRGNPDFGVDLPTQTQVDAQIGLRTGKIDLSLFVRNLTNEDVALQQLALFATNGFRPTGFDTRTQREEVVLRPRTFGLTARVSY